MIVGLLTALPWMDGSRVTFGLVCVLVTIGLLVIGLKPRERLSLTFCALITSSAVAIAAGQWLQLRVVGASAILASALGLQIVAFLPYVSRFVADEPRHDTDAPALLTRITHFAMPAALASAGLTLIQLWLGEPLPTLGSALLSAAEVLGVSVGLVWLAVTFFQTASLRTRYISGVVGIGLAIAYLPALFGTTIPLLLGRMPVISSTAAALALLALPVAVGFTSIRWRAGALIALIDRVTVYVLLGLFLLLTDIVLVLGAQRLVSVQVSLLSNVLTLGAACIAVATFTPMRAVLQRTVDTALYRDYYEFGPTLQRFSQRLATLQDQESVANLLLDGLTETLNLSGIAFIALPEGLDQRIVGLIEADDLRARGVFASPDGRADVLRGLASLDLGALKATWHAPVLATPWPGCAALVSIGPAQSSEGLALLVIGQKRTSSPLREDDLALLATLANQSATALANAMLIAGLTTSLKQVQISTEQLVAARAEQQLLLRELVDADERQRETLARDLHDDALQEVLYLIRHSGLCNELADELEQHELVASGTLERLRQELRHLNERSKVAERKLRALCLGLYPAMLSSIGLTAALEDLRQELALSTGLRIALDCSDDVDERTLELDEESSLHIYRIAQEALRNAAKHARASQAWVRLSTQASTDDGKPLRRSGGRSVLTVEIEDDGQGLPLPIDYGTLLREGHLGLAGMRERAERVGGTLILREGAKGGASILLQVGLTHTATRRTTDV